MNPERNQAPKYLGYDAEFENTIDGLNAADRCTPAAWALLAEIAGLPAEEHRAAEDPRPGARRFWRSERDLGRRWLPNGSCWYCDSGHAEGATPLVRSARQSLAYWHAQIRTLREAVASANGRLPAGQRVRAAVANSDGYSHSFGCHCNFLCTRLALFRIFHHRPTTAWLSAFQVSGVVLWGAGKLGSENNRPFARYQISQRADFFEIPISEETMFCRPIVNTRDEPHGDARFFGRYHYILPDANLCHVAHYLKMGTTAIILTMIEAEVLDPRLCLADPVRALIAFSHDPTLHASAPLAGARAVTAVELQLRFLAAATVFVEGGGCDGLVPQARQIITLWADTLAKLERREFGALAGKLDWVLKMSVLEANIAAEPALGWNSPEMRLIDRTYGDLTDGLFWRALDAGLVDRLIDDSEIETAMREAPEDTRSWTHARLLSLAKPEEVIHVDWESITFRLNGERRTVWLHDPTGFARKDNPIGTAHTLEEALAALGAYTVPAAAGITIQTQPTIL